MRIVLRLFYKNIHFVGLDNIPTDGPVMLAVTHPNSFMDDVILGAFLKRNVIFLARGDVFKKPWAKFFLHAMHVYPIYRGKDTQGDVGKNLDSFTFYRKHLKKRKTILIHPEGLCVNEKRVRPLKKGMGRIAFDAEEENEWKLGVQIVPITLNYTNAPYQGESLMVQVGESIPAVQYKNIYQENPAKAYAQLAKDVYPILVQNGVVQEKGTEKVSEMLLEVARNNSNLKLADIISRDKRPFVLEKQITDKINLLYTHPNWNEYQIATLVYQKRLTEKGILDRNVKYKPKAFNFLELIAGAFILLWNWPVNKVPQWTEKLIKSIEFRASVLLGISFVIYLLQISLLTVIAIAIKGLWGLLLIPFGLIVAFGAKKIMGLKEERLGYKNWGKLPADERQELQEMRRNLVSKLLD